MNEDDTAPDAGSICWSGPHLIVNDRDGDPIAVIGGSLLKRMVRALVTNFKSEAIDILQSEERWLAYMETDEGKALVRRMVERASSDIMATIYGAP